MAQATFSIRMDEELKKEFDALCTEFGMNATTAFNVFARAVVREKRIPFEIVSPAARQTENEKKHPVRSTAAAGKKRKESAQ